jgi:hypothetical protein
MKNCALSGIRLGVLAVLAGWLISSVAAQQMPSMEQGIASDWSMHHVIFSNPGTEQEAVANGTYERWLKVVNDPRYIFQQLKRGEPVQGPAAEAVAAIEAQARAEGQSMPLQPGGIGNIGNGQLKGLWEENMGTGAKVGADQYPSTYSYGSSPSCSDFAVYNTNLAGSSTVATIVGYTNLYATTCGTIGSGVPTLNWAYNTTSGSNKTILNSIAVSPDGTQIAFVQNDAGALNDAAAQLILLKWNPSITSNQTASGCSYTNGSTAVTCTGGGLIAAEVSSQVTSSKTGIPTGDTLVAASGMSATLAAAATSTQSGATITIHVQTAVLPGVPPTAASGAAYRACIAPCMLVLTFSSTNDGGNSSFYSAPYYDIADDIIYVGDDGPSGAPGRLHKFTNVFLGTPAEVATGGWPATVASNDQPLGPPVYDSASGRIFVGDLAEPPSFIGNGGVLHAVNTSGTVVANSSQIDFYDGIVDAPIVDSSNGKVYVSVGCTALTGTTCTGNSAVYQFATSFTSGAGSSVTVGTGGSLDMYDGQFDNQYYTSSNGTGGFYVCGHTGGAATVYQIPISANTMGTVKTGPPMTSATETCSPVAENLAIDKTTTLTSTINNVTPSVPLMSASGFPAKDFIQIDSEVMQIMSVSGNTLTVIRGQFGTSAAGHNSGATVDDIHDRIFLSVEAEAITGVSGCTGGSTTVGCVFNFDLTVGSGMTESTEILPTAALSGLNSEGGSSGMVIDNGLATTAGAGQIYFTPLGNQTCTTSGTSGGCAMQASQSALQ